VHRTDPIPELGYILHPSAWGKGYATEAVGAIIQHLFEARPELDTIEAKVDEKNAESIRVLQKCGFVEIETITGGAKLEWLDPPKRNMLVYRVERTKSIE
jgi:RimJ/RimL family protein N-acetyltransferase